jgi:Asp-tRNA(Asn)/Glu-tRNA(Gln) amidotransferase A subunit family amidase
MRSFIARAKGACSLAAIALMIGAGSVGAETVTFDLETATIEDINAAFEAGALTSEHLLELYMARIDAYDRGGLMLNSIVTLNPEAMEIARALDEERAVSGPRSPLHGIPVVFKDVLNTMDMPTSGGFLPMIDSQPDRDAFVVERLREAGAIILGKTNLNDWFGQAPSGSSTAFGYTLSPYNIEKYTGGSSTGTGTAMGAWLATVGFGSDTTGSLVHPAANNALVVLVGTQGLISRGGLIQTSFTHERTGPLTRSVYDAAAVLDIVAGFDPNDLVTAESLGHLPMESYTTFVDPNGLEGARIGVLRGMFRSGPEHEESLVLAEQALEDMEDAGAILMDPVSPPFDLYAQLRLASVSSFERQVSHNHYLSHIAPDAPIQNIEEMVAAAPDIVDSSVRNAVDDGPLDRNPEYLAHLAQRTLMREELVALMDELDLDVLVMPLKTLAVPNIREDDQGADYGSDSRIHSVTGLPSIVVPGGVTASDGMPFGVQFIGRPYSEPTLIKIASGYEAATHHRFSPPLTPALEGETFTYETTDTTPVAATP